MTEQAIGATGMPHGPHASVAPAIRPATGPRFPSGTGPGTVPTMGPLRAFRTPVRGHAFAAPPPGAQRPGPGVGAELAREPDNPADPLAVAVWASPQSGARWRIGYLDRAVAARVAPRLDAGGRMRAQLDGWSSEPQGRWRRPLLLLLPDGREPLAPPRPQAPVGIWGRPPGMRRRRVN